MRYALIDTFNSVVLSLHRIERCAEDALQKHDRQVRLANGAGSYIPKQIIWDADHTLRVGEICEPEQFQKIDRESRIYRYECFGDLLDMAEGLGWADTYPSSVKEGWTPTEAEACEDDAIDWIEGKGFTVVYPED
jgi:hypothetical protein